MDRLFDEFQLRGFEVSADILGLIRARIHEQEQLLGGGELKLRERVRCWCAGFFFSPLSSAPDPLADFIVAVVEPLCGGSRKARSGRRAARRTAVLRALEERLRAQAALAHSGSVPRARLEAALACIRRIRTRFDATAWDRLLLEYLSAHGTSEALPALDALAGSSPPAASLGASSTAIALLCGGPLGFALADAFAGGFGALQGAALGAAAVLLPLKLLEFRSRSTASRGTP
jgi:hypothetical protein